MPIRSGPRNKNPLAEVMPFEFRLPGFKRHEFAYENTVFVIHEERIP